MNISLRRLSENFLNLRIIQRDNIIEVHRSSCKAPVILIRYSKNTQIRFHVSVSSGRRVVPCGRTDGQEANTRFSQFCGRT